MDLNFGMAQPKIILAVSKGKKLTHLPVGPKTLTIIMTSSQPDGENDIPGDAHVCQQWHS